MNAVSQWWIGGLRTRKAKAAGSIPAGGSNHVMYRRGNTNVPKHLQEREASFMRLESFLRIGLFVAMERYEN